jgi:hypothetical protein
MQYYAAIWKVAEETAMHLTEREKAVGMEPRWLPIEEIKSIFHMHQKYAETDEMRRGMYLREYIALCELEGEFKRRSVTLIK